jgi:hypothetical protein
LAVSAPVDWEPLTDLLPDHAPPAVQAVALVDDQLSVAAEPLVRVLGVAFSETVGAGWVTDTVVDCEALAPAPVQVIVYVVFAVRAPVDAEPLTGSLPAQPPEAVQAVALVEDQLRVELPPLATVLGLALSVTVAAGAALTVTVAVCTALPPGPVQVSE